MVAAIEAATELAGATVLRESSLDLKRETVKNPVRSLPQHHPYRN